jgi:hypothetical protein
MNRNFCTPRFNVSTIPLPANAENCGFIASVVKNAQDCGFLPNNGPQGPQGPHGPTGAQGPIGPEGVPGTAVNTGAQGPQGQQGPTGVTGPQGPQGVPGVDGSAVNTGAQGAIGPQGPAGPAGSPGAYGSFYDTTSQLAYLTNTPYAMRYNTTAESQGGVFVDDDTDGMPTKIVFTAPGTYNIQFSAQLDKFSGSGELIYIWLRANGIDVPWSASEIAIQGTLSESIPAWNFIYTSTASYEYVQLMWSVTDTRIYIKAQPAAGVVPGIPSLIATVVQIR